MHPYKTFLFISLSVVAIVTQGCESLSPKASHPPQAGIGESRLFIRLISKNVRRTNVSNRYGTVVPHYPYLKTNRFLTSYKQRTLSDNEFNTWLEMMRDLNADVRQSEIQNLPDSYLQEINSELDSTYTRSQLLTTLMQHLDDVYEHDKMSADFKESVQKAVKNKSQYSRLQKFLGFYPLFYLPTLSATDKAYNEFRHWHTEDFDDTKIIGSLNIFSPPDSGLSAEEVKYLYAGVRHNAIDVPIPSVTELIKLIKHYAPIIHQDVDDDFDQFGEVTWRNGAVALNYDKPTVYYYITYGYIKNQPALQLNYSLWYKGRLGPNAPRLERGDLDGLTYRVTLDSDGIPIMVDTTNNCGCYHFFVPNGNKIISEISKPGLNPLVVRQLPVNYPDLPLHLRVNTGWHQIIRMKADQRPSTSKTYQLVEYDHLESLPREGGLFESVFNDRGIMKDSYRIEPYLFFPSGVKKVGYMRQRHNQPIKLIGEAHFSDPYLINNNFLYK